MGVCTQSSRPVCCVMQLPIINMQSFPSTRRLGRGRHEEVPTDASRRHFTRQRKKIQKINDAMAGLVSSMRSDATETCFPHSSADSK
jgi:hypothetical protein